MLLLVLEPEPEYEYEHDRRPQEPPAVLPRRYNPPMRVVANTAWQIAGRVAALGIGLATLRLIAHALGPDGLGAYATILNVAALLGVASDLGVQIILVRDLARAQDDGARRRLVESALGLRLAAGAAAALAACALAALLPYPAPVGWGLLLAAPALVLNAVVGALLAPFEARLEMRTVAAIDIAQRAVAYGLCYAAVLRGASVLALAFLLVPPAVLQAALALRACRRALGPVVPRCDLDAWRRFLIAGVPLGIGAAIVCAHARIDLLLTSSMLGEHAAGLYALGHRVKGLAAIVPAAVTTSLFPLAVATAAGASRRIARRGVLFLAAGGAVAAATLWFAAPLACRVLGGAAYAEAVAPLRVLGVATGLAFPNALLGYLLVARGRAWEVPILSGVVLSSDLILIIHLVPWLGPVGAAWAAAGGEAVGVVLGIARVRRAYRAEADGAGPGEAGAMEASTFGPPVVT